MYGRVKLGYIYIQVYIQVYKIVIGEAEEERQAIDLGEEKGNGRQLRRENGLKGQLGEVDSSWRRKLLEEEASEREYAQWVKASRQVTGLIYCMVTDYSEVP